MRSTRYFDMLFPRSEPRISRCTRAAWLGDLCKARVIETGAARPSETWARSTALKAWKRKAVLAYGELYTDVKNAKDITALPRSLLKRETQPDGSMRSTFLRDPMEVLEEYGTKTPDGVRLVVMGAVGHGGAG